MRAFLVAVVVTAGNACAQDLRISDFRIPETRFARLLGTFQANASHRKSDEQTKLYLWQTAAFENERSIDGSVIGALDYDNMDVTEARTHELSARLDLDWIFDYLENERGEPSTGQLRKERTRTMGESVRMNTQWRGSFYLEPEKWYVFLNADLLGSFSLSERSEKLRDSTFLLEETVFYRGYGYDASLGGGVGYGKVRDGRDVFAVLRILENLRADGALTRDLTRDEVLFLVAIYARLPEYQGKHERSVKFFMGDFLGALRDMKVVREESLDPYSVLRSLEVLSERIRPRRFGWRIHGGWDHRSSQTSSVYQSRKSTSKQGLDYGVGYGEYGLDLSLYDHVAASLEVNIPMVRRSDRRIDISFGGTISHELSERIECVAGYTFQKAHNNDLDSFQSGSVQRRTTHDFSSAFYFFVENSVSFQLGVEYIYRIVDTPWPSLTRRERTQFLGANAGITYRFF